MRKQFNLDQIEKINDIFDAPKGYFEALPLRIQRRIGKPQKQAVWAFGIKPKYALILASLTILLVFGGKFLFFSQAHNSQAQLSEIPEQQIRQYLLQDDIHEYYLMNLYIESANEQEKSEEAAITEEILETEIDIDEIEELL
jgi:hypothetical protein